MSKNIIIAILAISIGGLVTVIINQKKKIAQDDKMSEYYLDFHSQENFWFAKKMIADIESEVNDQGKLVNAGLIDTINWMLDQHEALLRDSSQTFSEEQAIAYSNSLEKMLLGMVRGKVKDNNPYWYPKTDWNSYPSSSDRIWRMMQLEYDFLSISNERLGFGGFWIDRPFPFFDQVQDTVLLKRSDTVGIRLGVEWHNLDKNSAHIDFDLASRVEWNVSIGWMGFRDHSQCWFIDTKALDTTSVFEATITGKRWYVGGGYRNLSPWKQIFRLVD